MKSSLIRIGVASLLMAGVISVAGIAFQDREVNAAAATYYVATNGSDSNPGTESSPFQTIGRGVKNLGPGDTLIIKGGTYAESFNNNIPGGTSWSSAVTLKAYSGDSVTIQPPSGTSIVLRLARSASSYIIFDGLIFDGKNVKNQTVNIESSSSGASHHIRFLNGVIKNSAGAQTNPDPSKYYGAGVDANVGSDYLEFINMKIHDNGASPYDHGLYLGSANNLVENSEVFNNSGTGIDFRNSKDGSAAKNSIARNNKVYNNGRLGGGGSGILLGGTSHMAYNNVVWGNPQGMYVAWGSNRNNKIYNNTIYANNRSGGTGRGIWVNRTSSGAVVRNNIVYNNRAQAILDEGSGTTQSNNLTSNPQFVNASGANFRLQSSSPAINAGTTLPEVPCDFDGNKRPGGSAYDIGAFEYGSSPASDCPKGTTGGPTPTPPATPTPVPPPAITLTATPSSLSIVGQGTQLFWTVQNATSCNASGGWSGAKDPGGGTERHTPTQSTTYVLTCTGSGGTAQKSVTVTMGATGACARYSSGSTIPQGFGVPWDVTNPSSLLLKADCTPPTVVLKVGDNANTTYVYKTGYAALAGATSWTAVDLFEGTLISQAWYVGFAQGIAQIQSLTNPAYYVAYTCKWNPTTGSGQAGQWKCGCRDFACAQSYWQIQRLQQ